MMLARLCHSIDSNPEIIKSWIGAEKVKSAPASKFQKVEKKRNFFSKRRKFIGSWGSTFRNFRS